MRLFIFLTSIFFAISIYAQQKGKVTFDSNDPELNNSFKWAKKTALSYVHDSDPVGPWYEAALPNREAFCMRDVAHQTIGASILGLNIHNLNMLMKFADNISASKDYCSFWEINRYNNPAPVDFRNDKDFWYNLPANFDILDACYRQYMWTGKEVYLHNTTFLDFYTLTINDYVDAWDLGVDNLSIRDRMINLPQPRVSSNSFHFMNRGIPTYNEGGRGQTKLGIDLIAALYAGYHAYAQLSNFRGDTEIASLNLQKANEVKTFINDFWWDKSKNEFKTIQYEDETFDYFLVGNNQAYSHYLLYFRAVNDSMKIESIIKNYNKFSNQLIVELASHLPVFFYQYGKSAKGNSLIKKLASEENTRRDYPENSFAIIGDMVTGLMGISGEFPTGTVNTLSNLQKTLEWAEIKNLPIFSNEINVRHNSVNETSFTNQTGSLLKWGANFHGEFNFLYVDGLPEKSNVVKNNLGAALSKVIIAVKPGQTIVVKNYK